MDQYAIGEIKAVEPSEKLPKYKFKKWEEYYTKAVDCIEEHYPSKNRQWCHDQLNKALDNTEFHHVDDYELQCQMIDEILAGEFGMIEERQNMRIFVENKIFGDQLSDGLIGELYSQYVVNIDGGDCSVEEELELDSIKESLSNWIMNHITKNNGGIVEIPPQNPYLDWSEDSIGDELFELKEWMVDNYLSSGSNDPVDTQDGSISVIDKYNMLQDAMEKLNEKESK